MSEKWESSYWARNGRFQADHDRLFELLVPPQGKARTMAGEVLRMADRITYDHYNNGRGNMYEDSYIDRHKGILLAHEDELQEVANELGIENFEGKLRQFMMNDPNSEKDEYEYETDYEDVFDCVDGQVMDEVMDVVVSYVLKIEKEGFVATQTTETPQ